MSVPTGAFAEQIDRSLREVGRDKLPGGRILLPSEPVSVLSAALAAARDDRLRAELNERVADFGLYDALWNCLPPHRWVLRCEVTGSRVSGT